MMTRYRRALLAEMCRRIGCTGALRERQRCPGNPACKILRGAADHPVVEDLVGKFLEMAETREDLNHECPTAS